MNNQTNVNTRIGFFRMIGDAVVKLFKKSPLEPREEQKGEEFSEEVYRIGASVNYTEIFANRLTNYALYGGTVTCDDEEIDKCLKRLMKKSRKAVIWSLVSGRVYLVPYTVGGEIYTDIIPQSRSIVTRRIGDDVLGFACMADLRVVNNKKYARWTLYDYDDKRKVFSIENKATAFLQGVEVPLGVVEEWADILPYIGITGVEKPLFGIVDSPKDNRSTDSIEGAPITFGCGSTISELLKNVKEFEEEFDKKISRLGVDKAMLAQDAIGVLDKYVMQFNGSGMGAGSLFEIFSPDIRDQAYINRSLSVEGRLEKQVGTSNGILTPADTSMATATQVRRSMFDTTAMIDAIRENFEGAANDVCDAYAVYLSLMSRPYNAGYNVTASWSRAYIEDDMERFNKIMQAHSAGIVSDIEYRREIYPNESPEEAQKALDEIAEGRPDPIEYIAGSDGGDGFGAEPTQGTAVGTTQAGEAAEE